MTPTHEADGLAAAGATGATGVASRTASTGVVTTPRVNSLRASRRLSRTGTVMRSARPDQHERVASGRSAPRALTSTRVAPARAGTACDVARGVSPPPFWS